MSRNFCPACFPHQVRSHVGIYSDDLIDMAFSFFLSKKATPQLPRFPAWMSLTHIWHLTMELIGVVRFSKDFNKSEHYPRSWACVEEAQRRGISIETIKIFGKTRPYYRVKFGSKYYYYSAVPSRFLNFQLDDKNFCKKMLTKQHFPVPQGKCFFNKSLGLHYGKKLGFPLAVKPAHGTHSYHVTAPVNNEEELNSAIRLAKQYQPRFIVEKYLIGRLYRVTVINFNYVYIARREAPNVVGDGTKTIVQLIAEKNSDPRRGATGQRDTTLHQISIKEEDAGRSFNDVPKNGEIVTLYHKTSIGSGGDIYEETPTLHPENREMFRRAARIFGTDLIGFDVIAEDLSKPYSQQSCGIIEANSIPMIDFHHYPSHGQPQNTAAALWDAIIADQRVRYLYPIMLAERSLYTKLIWHFMDIMVPLIRDTVLRFTMTHKFLRRQRFKAGWMKPGVEPESAITYLKLNGFEVVRPEWIDAGETVGLRKLLNHERQCHIRFFADGEIRAHIEYAPEARPIAHLLERNFIDANKYVHEILKDFIQ